MEAAAQAVVDALARRLGRGVSVDDPRGALLGFSAQHDDVDRARITSILTRQVPPAVAAWQEQHGIGTATGPVRVPANPTLGMDARVGVPLRRDGLLVGHLWVVEKGRPLDDADLTEVARAAAELAALAPAPTPADGRRDADVRLGAVVDGAPDAVDRLHAVLGDVDVRAVVVRLAATDREPGADPPAVRWTTPRSPRVLATHRTDAALVALVAGSDGTVDLAAVLDAVRRAAEEPGWTTVVGVGPELPVREVGTGVERATAAARVAAVDPALPPVVAWNDLGLYRDLFGDDDDPLVAVAAGGSSADLLRTLETYLDLAGDAGRTAAALSLHRTSLYYRLGRIEQVLAVDLGDGRTRTHLHLALKRRRLRGAP